MFLNICVDFEPVAGLNVPITRPRLQVQFGSGSGFNYGDCGSTGEDAIRIIRAGEQENSVGLGSISSMASSSSS